MLSFDEMPDDNAALAIIEIDFPHVPLDDVIPPKEWEPDILEHVKFEGFSLDGKIRFLRTALVEDVIYWIWEFYSGGKKVYATASQDKYGNSIIGCDIDYYGLTPEQFILGDYNNCF